MSAHEFDVAHAEQSTRVLTELAHAVAQDDAAYAEARLDGTIPEPLYTSDRAYPTVRSALDRIGQLEVEKALTYVAHALYVLETVAHTHPTIRFRKVWGRSKGHA